MNSNALRLSAWTPQPIAFCIIRSQILWSLYKLQCYSLWFLHWPLRLSAWTNIGTPSAPVSDLWLYKQTLFISNSAIAFLSSSELSSPPLFCNLFVFWANGQTTLLECWMHQINRSWQQKIQIFIDAGQLISLLHSCLPVFNISFVYATILGTLLRNQKSEGNRSEHNYIKRKEFQTYTEDHIYTKNSATFRG